MEDAIISSLLEKAEAPIEFFKSLSKLQMKGEGGQEQELSSVILKLNSQHNIDFCNTAIKALEQGASSWTIISAMRLPLTLIKCDVENTVELLRKLHQKAENNGGGMQLSFIEELVEKQRSFSRELLTSLLQLDEPFMVSYASELFKYLSKTNVAEIHQELISLADHPSDKIIRSVIYAICELDYTAPAGQARLDETIGIFKKLEEKQSSDVNYWLIHSYGKLAPVSSDARMRLLHYARLNDPKFDLAVSWALFLLTDKAGNEAWFKELLFELAAVPSSHLTTIGNIDSILYEHLRRNKDWGFVESFLVNWLVTSGYKAGSDDFTALFDSLLSLIADDKEKIEQIVTRFFNHDRYEVNHAAMEIIRYFKLYKQGSLKLSKVAMSGLDFVDLQYIARKILGLLVEPDVLLSLSFSFLEKSAANKRIQSLVHSIFLQLANDYHATTVEFLVREKAACAGKVKKKFIGDLISQLKKNREALDSLPRLQELKPSRQRMYAVSLARKKEMQKIMESSQSKSVLLDIVTKVPVKCGIGFFSYFQSKYMDVTKFSSHSHSIELAMSELSHPVKAARDRVAYRLAKRGNK